MGVFKNIVKSSRAADGTRELTIDWTACGVNSLTPRRAKDQREIHSVLVDKPKFNIHRPSYILPDYVPEYFRDLVPDDRRGMETKYAQLGIAICATDIYSYFCLLFIYSIHFIMYLDVALELNSQADDMVAFIMLFLIAGIFVSIYFLLGYMLWRKRIWLFYHPSAQITLLICHLLIACFHITIDAGPFPDKKFYGINGPGLIRLATFGHVVAALLTFLFLYATRPISRFLAELGTYRLYRDRQLYKTLKHQFFSYIQVIHMVSEIRGVKLPTEKDPDALSDASSLCADLEEVKLEEEADSSSPTASQKLIVNTVYFDIPIDESRTLPTIRTLDENGVSKNVSKKSLNRMEFVEILNLRATELHMTGEVSPSIRKDESSDVESTAADATETTITSTTPSTTETTRATVAVVCEVSDGDVRRPFSEDDTKEETETEEEISATEGRKPFSDDLSESEVELGLEIDIPVGRPFADLDEEDVSQSDSDGQKRTSTGSQENTISENRNHYGATPEAHINHQVPSETTAPTTVNPPSITRASNNHHTTTKRTKPISDDTSSLRSKKSITELDFVQILNDRARELRETGQVAPINLMAPKRGSTSTEASSSGAEREPTETVSGTTETEPDKRPTHETPSGSKRPSIELRVDTTATAHVFDCDSVTPTAADSLSSACSNATSMSSSVESNSPQKSSVTSPATGGGGAQSLPQTVKRNIVHESGYSTIESPNRVLDANITTDPPSPSSVKKHSDENNTAPSTTTPTLATAAFPDDISHSRSRAFEPQQTNSHEDRTPNMDHRSTIARRNSSNREESSPTPRRKEEIADKLLPSPQTYRQYVQNRHQSDSSDMSTRSLRRPMRSRRHYPPTDSRPMSMHSPSNRIVSPTNQRSPRQLSPSSLTEASHLMKTQARMREMNLHGSITTLRSEAANGKLKSAKNSNF